jgi:MATE family multidrug resistance protein
MRAWCTATKTRPTSRACRRRARRLAGLVRHHARHALHRHLLHRQGDALCKGCGRTEDEVQHWPAMGPARSARCGAASRRKHGLALQPLCRARGFALPASLLFTVYRGFNNAVSRPKAVMALQMAAWRLKVPLSACWSTACRRWACRPWAWWAAASPPRGDVGAGAGRRAVLLARDPFYRASKLRGRGLHRRIAVALRPSCKRLGVPMGMAILIEVTGFALHGDLHRPLGTTPVAGHQIAANLVSILMFMLPLALGNATSTLVAQRVGRRPCADARRVARHGIVFAAAAVGRWSGSAVFGARHGVVRPVHPGRGASPRQLPCPCWPG